MRVIEVKRTRPNTYSGREGLMVKDRKTIYDDTWLHEDILKEDMKESKKYGVSNNTYKSDTTQPLGPLSLVVDLSKSTLNTGKLVKRRVEVKGKNGKTFFRMQWVDPNDKSPELQSTGKHETTYQHHEHGLRDIERAQSNRFPVVHHPTKDLKMDHKPDEAKVKEAMEAYHRGEALPPVKVNDRSEVIDNHHLAAMAKKLGLSHTPSIVFGNSGLKKDLESKLKDEVVLKEHGEEQKIPTNNGGAQSHNPDVETFKNFTSKKYTKQHIMDEARKQGIEWKETTKSGELLPDHSSIAWMRAHTAIVDHINKGGSFEVSHVEKDVDQRMKQEGHDSIHKHFLKLVEKHGGRENLMQWAKDNDISWKEKQDPSINWMYAATAIKQELAKGKMLDGIRTRQKGAMEEANLVVSDQIKGIVRDLGKTHGKKEVMARADALGIEYQKTDAKGNAYSLDSPIAWMRASEGIQRFLARGGTFGMEGDEDTGIKAEVGDYGGATLAKHQSLAVDLGKRNSQKFELKAKEWALKAFRADLGDEADAHLLYDKFMSGARNAKVMMHFDPEEVLPNGATFLEQLMSDGELKNNWSLDRVDDPESMEISERELFDTDYDDAPHKDRPSYGVIDLFNQGLGSSPYGEAAFVLKDNVKKRVTGVHTDSGNLPYETNGKLTRSMEDPHHLIVDRWKTKWESPKNRDAKRQRYMDSIINGTKNNDDGDYFEAHVHGAVNLREDIDHVLVPSHWKTDDSHSDKHEYVKAFADLMGIGVKYDGEDESTKGSPNAKADDISGGK